MVRHVWKVDEKRLKAEAESLAKRICSSSVMKY